MFEILKQSVFVSLGLASLARDKVDELATEVSRRAKLSEAETTEFREELARRTEAARHDFETEIDHRIDRALIQLGIVKAGMRKSGEEVRHELQAFIDRRIEAALERLGVAPREDVQSLTARLELLERKIAAK